MVVIRIGHWASTQPPLLVVLHIIGMVRIGTQSDQLSAFPLRFLSFGLNAVSRPIPPPFIHAFELGVDAG
jgi:hypothetical protein